MTQGTTLLDRPRRPVRFSVTTTRPRRTLLVILLLALAVTGYALDQQGTFAQWQHAIAAVQRAMLPTRDPALWPFTAQSPWNLPIADTAMFELAGGSCTSFLTDPTIPANLNTVKWSHAVFLATSTDPVRQVTIEYDPATRGKNTITLRIPPNATPSPPPASEAGDARMYIVDPTHHIVDEFWKMAPTIGGNWTARVHVHTDLYSTGVGAWGTRAYGGSAIGGLLRVGELRNGIPHAIAIAVPERQQNGLFVWPAIARDFGFPDSVYHGPIPMGQFVAIPPTVNLQALGLSPEGLRLASAMQNYGAYVVDSSSDNSYYADPPVAAEVGGLEHDLPRIHALLRCVTNNTATTIGGGAPDAKRRAHLAPPLQGASFTSQIGLGAPLAWIPLDRKRQIGQKLSIVPPGAD